MMKFEKSNMKAEILKIATVSLCLFGNFSFERGKCDVQLLCATG